MKRGSLTIKKQPPPAVLVDEVFEFAVESKGDESDLTWVVDKRVALVQEPRKVKHGCSSSFRVRFLKASAGATISVSLVRRDGTEYATTSTTAVSTAFAKVVISKTHDWTDVWFKDEGGREKCMELVAGVYNQKHELIKSSSTVQVSLCYAPNHHGTVPVANQDILRVLNNDLHTKPDGTVKIRYRVEDVSKNHQGQDFCLMVEVANRADVALGLGPPVKIRSKRNKRGRATQCPSAAKANKKAVVGPVDCNHRDSMSVVSKWVGDATRAMYPWQQNNAVFRQLLLRYEKEVRIEIYNMENGSSSTKGHPPPSMYPTSNATPTNGASTMPWAPRTYYNTPNDGRSNGGFQQWSPCRFRPESNFPSSRIRPPSAGSRASVDGGNLTVEAVLGKKCEFNGTVLGLPALSYGDVLIGFFQPNGTLRRGFSASEKEMCISILKKKESPLFTRQNDGPKFVQQAFGFVRSQEERATKPMTEVNVPIGTPNGKPKGSASSKLKQAITPTRNDDEEEEERVEFIVARSFKSSRTGESLGFPAYSGDQQLIGFYNQGGNGLHRFVPASDEFSGPKELALAAKVLEQAGDAVQSRSEHVSVFSMINHALVYEFSRDVDDKVAR